MRHTLIILAALAVILLGAWGTLVFYFDEARLKTLVHDEVLRQTGRSLELRGPLRLRLLPRIALDARDVRLSGPPGYEGPGLFEADRLNVSLSLWPLVRGEIEVGDIGLEGAELRIHADRSGRSSLGGLYREAKAARVDAEPSVELRTGRIRIQNVALVLSDAATGETNRLQIDLLELERFVRDEPAPFVFRGAISDPPVLDTVHARGSVTVPSGAGPVIMDRISLDGRLTGAALVFSLDGRLLADRGPPLGIELADGRLRVDRDHHDLALLDLRQVHARAQARDGILVIDPLAGNLAGGRLDARVAVDFRETEPVLRMEPRFHVERLAEALAPWGLDTIVDGRGDVRLELLARGLEMDELLRSLTGTGSYSLHDGRVHGIDLDALAKGIRARDPAAAATAALGGETRFNQLAGVVEIIDGRLRLPDLGLTTEYLGLAGRVDLALSDLSLDGRLQLSGERLERVPLIVGGSLSAPRLDPDVAGVAREELGRRLLEGLERRLGGERETQPLANDGGRHE